jgi:4-amino-4-deoxy-L-arabinose transferase-like glycosyltransferase
MSARLRAHPLVLTFVLALVLRVANVALLHGENAFFAEPDALTYWALGSALAKRETFWPTLLSLTDRMPLYPLFIAATQSAFGDSPRAVALLQSVIDAGTCALIAVLGGLASRRVGLIAGILAAVSPTLIILSSQILTDTLALFFFSAMLVAVAFFLRCSANALAAVAGLAGGLALATRPAVALLLVGCVPLIIVAALVQRRRLMSALASGAFFALCAVAPIAPVLLRNAVVYDSFSLTSQTGDHLASWIFPLVKERADGTAYQASVAEMEVLYQRRLAERRLGSEANPFVRSAIKTVVAEEQLRALPLKAFIESWVEGMLVNLAVPAVIVDPRMRSLPKPSFYNTAGNTLWQKTRSYLFDQPGLYQTVLVIGILAMLPFLALQAAGFLMLVRALPWAALLAFGLLAYFLLLTGPVTGPKYRLPIEPILIVLTALPLARFFDRRYLIRSKMLT